MNRESVRALKSRLGAELWAWRRARMEFRDPNHAALVRGITQSMQLPPSRRHRKVKGSVWAISLVKNEADIIVQAVEHMFRQGVVGILIADNGSTDDTPRLLEELGERYPLFVARDGETRHFQGGKIDLLCEWVRRAGADWIVPFDADEFWFAPGMTLSEYLKSCESDIVMGDMHCLYPIASVQFNTGAWRLQADPAKTPKVLFRSHRRSRVQEGNHGVRRPGTTSWGLRVLHVPWRSYEQFRLKGVQGREALAQTGLPPFVGCHWRFLGALKEAAALDVWDAILRGDKVIEAHWSPGGPAVLVDPLQWKTWDPEGVLVEVCPR